MRALLIPLVLLPLACGGETPQTATATPETAGEGALAPLALPSMVEAHTLVAQSAEFSEYQFTNAAYSLPMQLSAMSAPARGIAGRLAASGWIGLDGDGRVVLTQKARSDRRFLVRPNDSLDIVPLARKELTAVEAVSPNAEGQPLVDFRWEWKPNEIGVLFAPLYTGDHDARATLYRDGAQWRVLRIVPADP